MKLSDLSDESFSAAWTHLDWEYIALADRGIDDVAAARKRKELDARDEAFKAEAARRRHTHDERTDA
jgi:hypothetical protein